MRLLPLVLASLCFAGLTSWGFIGFLAGKHNHTAGRAIMLVGIGNLAITVSLAMSPTTWVRGAVFWTGIFVGMCGAVVAATAAKRRKYDRESKRPVSY